MRPAAALASLLLVTTAVADDADVRFRLELHGRFVDNHNQPQASVLFDRSTRAFDVAPYLRPQGSDTYGSTFAALGAEGRRGALRWAIAADTGELRVQQFPGQAPVCFSNPNLSPSGLDVVGSGRCNVLIAGRRPAYAVDETRPAPAQLTSNGRPLGDEIRSTLLLREAWIGAAFGKNDFALVKVGRKRFTVGDGFIYDDYGTGIDASFDLGALGPSFDVGVSLFYPTRDFPSSAGAISPMLAFRADWLPSLFEHAGVFVTLYRDQTGSVAELFRGSFAEPFVLRLQDATPGTAGYVQDERALATVLGSERDSDASLAWIGTSGRLGIGRGVRLDWTGALSLGNITITLPGAGQESHAKVSGKLAHVKLRTRASDDVELGGFLVYLSGDLPPSERAQLGLPERYGGFLGISPYVTLTNIFFNGGVAETFAARHATAPGVNGRGVLAPGLTAAWDPLRTLGFDGRVAYLLADAVGPFGGRNYGTEVDLEASWAARPWLRFVAEGDVLFPGDFFPGGTPVTRVVLGVDLVGM